MAMEIDGVALTPLARSRCLGTVPFTAAPNESANPALVSRSINPAVHANRTFDRDGIHGEILTFGNHDSAELEFSSQSHLVILLADGMSGGCEWNNGNQVGKLSSVPPNTILFNPAQNYLWIRKRTAQQHCRMLLLTIGPMLVNRLDVSEVNVAGLRFRQQIGIEDPAVRQALVAIKQEIEAPGLNSRLYVDALLMLLLIGLMRCASNFTPPRQSSYVKGGLPNWRMKRALELLQADPTKMPSLCELAEPLRLRPTSFCRAFKQSTGLSPHRYLLSQRVDRAKEMMKDRARTLTEIGLIADSTLQVRSPQCSSELLECRPKFIDDLYRKTAAMLSQEEIGSHSLL